MNVFLCGVLRLSDLAGLLSLVEYAFLPHGSRMWYLHLHNLKTESSWLAVQKSNFLHMCLCNGGTARCVRPQRM